MALVDYPLSPEDRGVLDAFRKMVSEQIAPNARKVERDGVFPTLGYKRLADIGYLGLGHDPGYGGTFLSAGLSVLMQEALGAACASTYLSSGASSGLFGLPLSKFGSDEQKQRWLPALVKGDVVGSFGLTEAHAGSDVAAMKTRARKDGSDWVLDGEKMWITNAPCCDVAIVFAKTQPDTGYAGVSLFLVERGTRGFHHGNAVEKLGFRGSPTGALIFDNCRVPGSAMVGEEGMGFMMAMATLEYGRIGMAALSLGIAQAAFDLAVSYVRERSVFGKPLAKFQDVQFKLADLATELELARTLLIRAAETKERQGEARTLASMAKLYASELANRSTEVALQLHGANGYSEEFPLARLHRDARLCPIGEGASAIQRTLIARAIFLE